MEKCPRYDSLRFITRKSESVAAISVFLAKAHEIDEMAELNNMGLDGANPSCFSCDNKPDINQRA